MAMGIWFSNLVFLRVIYKTWRDKQMKTYITIPLALLGCLIVADAIYLAINYTAWWASIVALNLILIVIYILTHFKEKIK